MENTTHQEAGDQVAARLHALALAVEEQRAAMMALCDRVDAALRDDVMEKVA